MISHHSVILAHLKDLSCLGRKELHYPQSSVTAKVLLLFCSSHRSTFSVSPQAHASIYPGHAGASLSAVSGGGGSDFLSISRKRRCQSEEREARAASRQLSRLPLCVTGSWKRSCGSSCSLADEKAAEVRKSQQTGRSHRYKGKYGKSVFHFCRSNYIAVVSWRLLSLFTSFYHLK